MCVEMLSRSFESIVGIRDNLDMPSHMGRVGRFCLRFKRRLFYSFRFREMFLYDWETCNRCGRNYDLCIGLSPNKWDEVNGKSEGCLCPDCFFQVAREKKIKIKLDDIRDFFVAPIVADESLTFIWHWKLGGHAR